MRICWTFAPADRISFRSIVDELVSYENDDFHQHAYYHTQPHPLVSISLIDSSTHDDEEFLLPDNIDDDDENDDDDDDNEHRN
jgi:hypothetical protein